MRELPAFVCPSEWNLTPQQAKLFGALMEAENTLSRHTLRERISHCDAPAIVNVVVCLTRKKLRPFRIEIENVWGNGYRIPDADKERLRAGEISLALERQAA